MNKKEYIMHSEELLQVQKVQVELLEEVDRICRKRNIHYTIIAGTMLGAIRHGKHIPWDDDADVGFLRAEYERFREACEQELDKDKFYFQDVRDTAGYRWGYGKLRRKGTKFIRFHQEHMMCEQGIFIDLFPFDNVPDNKIIKNIHYFVCFLLRKFLWSEAGRETEQNEMIRKLYFLMSFVPMKCLIKCYEGLSASTAGSKTRQVRILTIPTPKGRYGYERRWFLIRTRYSFDRLKLYGPRDYDSYLKYKYGEDYMVLPAIENRKRHPISMLELP